LRAVAGAFLLLVEFAACRMGFQHIRLRMADGEPDPNRLAGAPPDRFDSGMPALVRPTLEVHRSFLAAMAEFRGEGRGCVDDNSMIGSENREFGGTWGTLEGFAVYVQKIRREADEDAPRAAGWVACTTLWYVEGAEYFERLAIRHRLTDLLRDSGGHIGYDVRPTARRRGYATAMLCEALPVARALGLDEVLLTCDTDNVASPKVIEANRGRYEDTRGKKLRYWILTD
jgi:predicted acetyltransferase